MITGTEAEYQSDAGSTKRASYGVSFVNIYDKIDCVITAPYCIWLDVIYWMIIMFSV